MTNTNDECSLDETNRSWKANKVAQLLTVNTALQNSLQQFQSIRFSSKVVRNGTA